MIEMKQYGVWLFVLAAGLMGCQSVQGGVGDANQVVDARDDIPEVPREFRAAWVATVANIDWPSAKNLSSKQQRKELLAILDRAADLKLNAIILQIRPVGDALYESKLEPWSEFLTGKIGRAPKPYYDPLAFAVEEAHKRGIELHAWFNPYRVLHPSNKTKPSADHILVTRPDLVRKYGKHHWMDPGEPEVQAHSLAVMLDVVKRYDIDGVHLDDYFYPYPIKGDDGQDVSFPDDPSYERYRSEGGELERDDWRRRNVDHFIRDLYKEVKAIKPHVKVGISPFGIYRPGNPAHIQGFDQYEKLYADALRWYQEGWCDYFTPQLYWAIAPPPQSFNALLGWWDEQNTAGRHLWPGLYTSRLIAKNKKGFTPQEIAYQIQWTRTVENSSAGHVHFSMVALMPENDELNQPIAEKVYQRAALVPASPWLKGELLDAPTGVWDVDSSGNVEVIPEAGSLDGAATWVVQIKRGEDWSWASFPAAQAKGTVPFSADGKKKKSRSRRQHLKNIDAVVIFSIDRRGVRSAKIELERQD